MKTIEMKVGNRVVQFTTKSVTIDGAEFFYGKMSEIKHSAKKHVYAFKYNDEIKYLPYDPKYEQVLKAIFSQVNNIGHKTAAAKAPTQSKPAVASAPVAPVQPAAAVSSQPAGQIPSVLDTAPDVFAAPAAAEMPSATPAAFETAPAAPVAQDVYAPAPAAAPAVPADDSKLSKKEKKAKAKQEKALAKAAKSDAKSTDPDKKRKKKKALIVLAGIIVLIGLLSTAYFVFFGTSSNPSSGPNSTESQQYDDIDELIEDLDSN